MGREVTLAGLRLTADEWESLDDVGQLELLRALTVPQPPGGRIRDDDYEAYELRVEAGDPLPDRAGDLDFDLGLDLDLGLELALALGRGTLALSASPVS